MVTLEDVRRLALPLPGTYEALIGDRIKFKVGRIVYLSVAPDELSMGFAFPKEERAALVAAEPLKFQMPIRSDLRYNWARVALTVIELEELSELVPDAWSMAVSKRVSAAYFDSLS
ncbi:MAG: MmcQ/YjbR family DNA-binding protein [Jatrophihabitantaceae bacterium]